MDNSMTTWIIVALLVLLIGAAIFMLLRRPGGDDDSLDGREAPAMGHDTDRRDDLDGRTAPEETQAVAPDEDPARDDAPFDQTSYDSPAAASGATGGATAVDRADVADEDGGRDRDDAGPTGPVADDTAEARRPADDFFGVDREPREEVESDPMYQDPRTDGHLMTDDEARHDEARQDAAWQDETTSGGVGDLGDDRPGGEGYLGAPASEGYHAEPASHAGDVVQAEEDQRASLADEQAVQAPPAAAPPQQQEHLDPHHVEPQQDQHEHTHQTEEAEHPAGGAQHEPLTADEVLDSRDAADRDPGAGDAEQPVAAGAVATEPAMTEPSADGPAVDGPQAAPAGGHVFAESVYGVGSVEPAEDGSGPEGWTVKGNTGSMLFHTADSPSYDAVRAEVWFDSEESARNAGFAHWDRRRR